MARKLRSDANQAREAASTSNGVQEHSPDDPNGDAGADAIIAADADETLSDASWLPVAEAAPAAGVPPRTLFNWMRAGKVPSRRVGGVRVVPLGTVRRLARERAGDDSLPTSPATAASPAKVATDLDGDQAASLFAAFEAGETPLDLVQRRRLSPRIARSAWKEYEALRNATRDVRADRITATEGRLALLEDVVTRLGAAVFEPLLPEQVADLRRVVTELQETISALPVPTRTAFTCATCGAAGLVAARIVCTACNREVPWGFHPRE